MTSPKADVIRMIEALPDDCTLKDIQYYLAIRGKIEERLASAEDGRMIPHAKAKRRLEGWLKSTDTTTR